MNMPMSGINPAKHAR